MIEWIVQVIVEMKKAGLPVELIATVVGVMISILITYFVVRFFNKKHKNLEKKVEEEVNRIHELVEGNHISLEDALSKQITATTQLTDSQNQLVTQFNVALELLSSQINGDESITESQAVIIYGSIQDEARHEIENFYYKTKKWVKDKDLSPDGPYYEQLRDRVMNLFDALEADIVDKLRQFKYNGRYLDKFQSRDKIKSEWSHIANHIFVTLVERSNGVVEYSNSKADRLKSLFNIWLREKN